ncbi:hypothetical protein [Providencia sp. 2024EL-00732]|uniref:hypothetical protein n=1 Tax=Providencia sp. 2024EL-00732 TaxID=3374242 RepID=UPI0024AA3C8B|nr:hypothetical protein [Providencia rettgeri]
MRDDPVSFGLPEDETGDILAMVNLGDIMEVFTENSTFKMVSPDTLDPDRKHQETPWIYTKTSHFGASNELVANTILLANEFLEQLFSIDSPKRLVIIQKVRDIRNVLLEYLCSLISFTEKLKEEIDKYDFNKNEMNGRAHAYFPQIKNIDGIATELLITAKRCIQEISVLVNCFITLKAKHGRIDKLLSEIESEHDNANELIEVLRNNLAMCEYIFSLRNSQEHAATTDKPLIVKNFNIENGLDLSLPKWGIKNDALNFIHIQANEILNFLITFFEEVFLACIILTLPNFPVYKIYFNDAPKKEKPIRYCLNLSIPDTFYERSSQS